MRGSGFSPETRRQLSEADHRWEIKAIFRLAIALFSLVGLSVYAAAIPKWDNDFYWSYGSPNQGDWEDGFPLGVLLFALLWNLFAIYLMVHRKIAVRPWIPLIIDFLVWAVLVPAITWSAGVGMFLYWNTTTRDDLVDTGEGYVWDDIKNIGGLEIAGVIFACAVWVLEVALFIFACIDTHKWRKARKATPPSVRALDHGEYHPEQDDFRHSRPPPKYEEDARSIELSPTSPTAREFA